MKNSIGKIAVYNLRTRGVFFLDPYKLKAMEMYYVSYGQVTIHEKYVTMDLIEKFNMGLLPDDFMELAYKELADPHISKHN